MKKEIIQRMVSGFLMGIFIVYLITIITSIMKPGGQYYPTVPTLIDQMGSEINAVLFQLLFSGLYGSIWAVSSLIWKNENWSILKMTIVHFLITSIITLPIAYFTHWMGHNMVGLVRYFLIFIGIYAGVWLFQYISWKNEVKQLNTKIQEGSR